MLGFVVVGVFGEKMEDIEWPSAATPGDFAFFAGDWLVAAHLFAFGLIILLAGLKNVPHFRSSALQHRLRLRVREGMRNAGSKPQKSGRFGRGDLRDDG